MSYSEWEKSFFILLLLCNFYFPVSMYFNPTKTHSLTILEVIGYLFLTYVGAIVAYLYGKYVFGDSELQV